MKKICMEKANVVVGNCDRKNIIRNCVKAPYDENSDSSWLIKSLMTQKHQCPKTVIYCRSIKTCSILYKLFTDILKDNAYSGIQSANSRLFAMFHHSTSSKCKRIVMEEFTKLDSKLRVIFCTSAFGLEVNVPDIDMIITWGAPRSVEEFMQEFGRGGRDGRSSMSVLYYHGIDISKTATDNKMRAYATSDTCRRMILQDHFTPDVRNTLPVFPKHLCCDICATTCECLNCPSFHVSLLTDLQEDIELCAAVSKCELMSCHILSEFQRNKLHDKLKEYRESCLVNNVPSLLNVGILSGLSDSLIDSIVNNVHYKGNIEDLMSEYIFDNNLARSVMSIIDEILED